MHSNNYKAIFISLFVAYNVAQIILATFNLNTRYFSLLQLFCFVVPILYFINEDFNENLFENKQNFWNLAKNYLKINFNFKLEVVPYLLFGLLGLNLLNIGLIAAIEFFLPNELIEIFNSTMKNITMMQADLLTNHSKTVAEFLEITFFIALIPAICEEILFRGFLLQNIMLRNSPKFAIVVSALIFSLIHLNIAGFLSIFFVGLFLNSLFYLTKSIITSMFLHFLNNFFIIISTNFGMNINSENFVPIWFAILLFTLGGTLILLAYRRIKLLSLIKI